MNRSKPALERSLRKRVFAHKGAYWGVGLFRIKIKSEISFGRNFLAKRVEFYFALITLPLCFEAIHKKN